MKYPLLVPRPESNRTSVTSSVFETDASKSIPPLAWSCKIKNHLILTTRCKNTKNQYADKFGSSKIFIFDISDEDNFFNIIIFCLHLCKTQNFQLIREYNLTAQPIAFSVDPLGSVYVVFENGSLVKYDSGKYPFCFQAENPIAVHGRLTLLIHIK